MPNQIIETAVKKEHGIAIRNKKTKELIEFIRKGPGIAKVSNIKIIDKEPENFISFEVRH